MRRFLLAALVTITLIMPGAVHAEDASVIAVLPLNVSGKGLAIYGKPVADAIAKRLRRDLGARVETLPTSGAVPAHVGLVVDGRIVAAKNRRVVIEARVRDPAVGRVAAAVVTQTGALSAIDELAAELASKLAPHVRAAMAAQKRRLAAAKRQPKPTHGTASVPRPPDVTKRAPAAPRITDTRPAMVVLTPTGRAGEVGIAPPMLRAAYRIAARAGHRVVRSTLTGVQAGEVAAAEIRRTKARYALMIHVAHVGFDWHGPILSARGRVRVVVVGADGRRVFDRSQRTGTVVGSRGDRHGALVHYVAEQTADIAAPQIKRALAQ